MKERLRTTVATIVVLFVIMEIGVFGVRVEGLVGNIMWWVIRIVLVGIAIWAYLLIGYYIFLSLFSYGKAKRDYEIQAPKTTFLILVPAHNEEAVIAQTIENLHDIDYPCDLYHVLVVSDNSSDDTTNVARQAGADVVDTSLQKHDRVGVGKPAGLQYTLDEFDYEQYDYVMILDADNFVEPNILTELNSQILAHHFEAIQTYLDSKNTNRFQPLGYAASYWTMNRAFQLAKYRLGLPNSIGGTGFVVSTEWLSHNEGFKSGSLTEDLEMEIRIVESGGWVGWNHFTKIYDEKPERLTVSMVQRYRWSRGHWYVAFHNLFPLARLFAKTRKWRYLDQLNYLFSMRENVQMMVFVLLILSALSSLLFYSDWVNALFFIRWSASYIMPVTIFNFVILLYGFIPMAYGIRVDGHQSILKTIWAIIALMWFSFTYLFAQIAGLFTSYDQKSWAHTKHVQKAMKQ